MIPGATEISPNQKNHPPSTFINIPDWGNVEIDDEMIPLIVELNKMGIKTRQCCQGDKKQYSYITFDLKNLIIQKKLDDGPNGTIALKWNRH